MYSVPEVASRLGITAARLKLAIRSGQLPPPDKSTEHGVAVSGFSESWMQQAQASLARSGPAIRYLKFPDGRQVSILREDIWEKALKAAEG